MSVLREAFVDELRDLFDAENQLLKALPKMAKAAENDQLRAAFEEHEQQTRHQIYRLGQVFEAFEETARGKHCKGMEGLIEEAEELIEEEEGDAALIAAAQKAEHYEIAAYGTLASWAVALGQEEAMRILNETLEEEKATDKKLSGIAESVVNSQESQKESEEEEEPTRRPQPRRRAKSSRAKSSGTGRASQASKAPRSKRLRSTARKGSGRKSARRKTARAR
jgi:ferritin-like metal-binding protein YciE